MLKAAIDARSTVVLVIFLLGTATVFVGALRHALVMAWGPGPPEGPPHGKTSTLVDGGLVFACVAALVLLGFWIPKPLLQTIHAAARIVGGPE